MTNQLTKSEFFKAVNAIAAKLEGHRNARLKQAWAIVKEGRFIEVSKLITPTEIIEAVQAPTKPKAAKKTVVIKTIDYKGLYDQGFAAIMDGRKEDVKGIEEFTTIEEIEIEESTVVTEIEEPTISNEAYDCMIENLESNFGENTSESVLKLIDTYTNGYTNKNGKHVDAMNDFSGAYLEKRMIVLETAIKGITKAESIEELTGIVFGTLLKDYISRVASKIIAYGVQFKSKATPKDAAAQAKFEARNSYNQAPSSDGRMTGIEIDDLVHEVITDAYTGDQYDDNAFQDVGNVYMLAYSFTANAARRLMSQNLRSTKAKKNVTECTVDEALFFADELSIFTQEERQVIELSMKNSTKREIAAKLGYKSDTSIHRMFKAAQSKYYAAIEA